MAAISNYANSANYLSQLWSKTIKKVVPEANILQKTFPLKRMTPPLSGKYNVPINSNWPQGLTLMPAGSDQNLLSSITDIPALAQVDAPSLTNRLTITYEMIKRMNNDPVYQDLTKERFLNLKKSHTGLVETLHIYGSDTNGFGTVAAVAADIVTVTTAEWGAGNFLDRGNAMFDVYTSAGVFTGNTVTVIGVTRGATPRQLTLAAGDGAKVAATNILRIRSGSVNSSEYRGIKSILSETSNLFGVNIAQNPLFQGNRVNVAGALTFDALYASLIKVSNFNFDGDCMVIVNPLAFGDLVRQIEGARTFGGDQYNSRVMKRGLQMLEIVGPKGMLEIYGHPKVKEGDAFGLKLDTWECPGVCDIELMQSGGMNGVGPLWSIPGSNAVELKTYSQKSLFCGDPAANLQLYGIVNSAAISIGAV